MGGAATVVSTLCNSAAVRPWNALIMSSTLLLPHLSDLISWFSLFATHDLHTSPPNTKH